MRKERRTGKCDSARTLSARSDGSFPIKLQIKTHILFERQWECQDVMSVEERKEAETRDVDFDRATAEICRFLPGDKIPPFPPFVSSARAVLLCPVSSLHRWKHREGNLVDDSANHAGESERNRIIATRGTRRPRFHLNQLLARQDPPPCIPLRIFASSFCTSAQERALRNLIHG